MKTPTADLRIQRILVPVDFSDCSREAMQFAERLAKTFGARLILVHVVEPYLPTGDLVIDLVRSQANLQKEFKKNLDEWGQKAHPIARTVVRDGSPAHQIVEEACDSAADLIVISTHGRGAVRQLLMGSVAERVVRHARCPVLVVPWKKRSSENAASPNSKSLSRASRSIDPENSTHYEPIT